MSNGWIGVDLDGTLAHYDGWKGIDHIGEPVPVMRTRVMNWLAQGIEVRIVTARVSPEGHGDAAVAPIRAWCLLNLGRELEVTCSKDMAMQVLYDDRCKQVEHNTGRLVGEWR